MKKIYFAIFLLLGFAYGIAQPITPTYMDSLNINQVSALIMNNSDFGWDLSNQGYMVPKNQHSSPLFAASMWIGGFHNGGLHEAAMTYRQNGGDFWPGPLDTVNAQPDTAYASPYKRLWKIDRYDIANFIYNWNAGNVQNGTFIPHPTILNWPAHGSAPFARNLAPFVDINGDGLYNPVSDGDYPFMRGDQMIWWMFNDSAGNHGETGGLRMGIEVHACAYAYTCPSLADSEQVLNYTTFYHYDIFNRTNSVYDTTFIGLWIDGDLGNYQDDYIGCDVMNNYGFIYNGDNYDEDALGLTGYHTNLPALSCQVLQGPMADLMDNVDNDNDGSTDEPNETCMMSRFSWYNNTGSPQTGNPVLPIQFYNLFSGKWRDGTPMTYGGNGTNPSNPPTRYLFPGTSDPYGIALGGTVTSPVVPPVSNWTQYTAGVVKGDMRFIVGMGPFTMQPKSNYSVDYALVFSQDSANCYGGSDTCVLARVKKDNILIKNWFDADTVPSCLDLSGVGIKNVDKEEVGFRLYPNPASAKLFIECSHVQGTAVVEITDMLGKTVKAGIFERSQKYVVIPVEDLTPGFYTFKLKVEEKVVIRKFIKE